MSLPRTRYGGEGELTKSSESSKARGGLIKGLCKVVFGQPVFTIGNNSKTVRFQRIKVFFGHRVPKSTRPDGLLLYMQLSSFK